jgi:phosphatidylglycerol---prolipoprotein diacylglyceryl transferase
MIEWFPSERVVVDLGFFTVYWYGLLYVVAFALAYLLIIRLQKYRGVTLTRADLLELLTWGIVGVVAGGRLGYVLLYEPSYFFAHPAEIFTLSQGGMSSHGGFIGVIVAVRLFLRGRVLSLLAPPPGGAVAPAGGGPPERHPLFRESLLLFDIITIPAALGIALGRLGNVINHELYLTPLAQLVGVGAPLLMAGICYWHLRRQARPGTTIGLFLVVWSLSRFGEEALREAEWPLVGGAFTWGQAYTLPLLLVGLYLLKDEARSTRSR